MPRDKNSYGGGKDRKMSRGSKKTIQHKQSGEEYFVCDSLNIQSLEDFPSVEKISFSFLEAPPGVRKLQNTMLSKQQLHASQSNEENCCLFQPRVDVQQDLKIIKDTYKIDVLIALCSRRELVFYRNRPKLMETFANELGLNWIWCNCSRSDYRTSSDGSHAWERRALRYGARAMKDLLLLASGDTKISVLLFSVPDISHEAIKCFLSSFLDINFKIPLLQTIQRFPEPIIDSKETIDMITQYKNGVEGSELGNSKPERKLNRESLLKSFTIVVGNEFYKNKEKDEYSWRVYLKRKLLAGEQMKGNGLWFIRYVSFKVPSNDSNEEIVNKSPFCFQSHSWGTLVVEVTIYFRPRFKKDPMRIDYELDFSTSKAVHEQYFVLEFSRISPVTRLDVRRRRGWKGAICGERNTQEITQNDNPQPHEERKIDLYGSNVGISESESKENNSLQQRPSATSFNNFFVMRTSGPVKLLNETQIRQHSGFPNQLTPSTLPMAPKDLSFLQTPVGTGISPSTSLFSHLKKSKQNDSRTQTEEPRIFHNDSSYQEFGNSPQRQPPLSSEYYSAELVSSEPQAKTMGQIAPYQFHGFTSDENSESNHEFDEDDLSLDMNVDEMNEEELELCFELTSEERQLLLKSFEQFGLEEFAQIFIDNHVRLDCLAFINEEDLTLMGVNPIVHADLLVALKQITLVGGNIQNGDSEGNYTVFTPTSILYREIPYNEIEIEPNYFSAGFYGVVYRGIWRGQSVAVKKIKAVLDKNTVEEFRREAAIMERLNNHPAIAFFIGICTELEHLCMITKYYARGSAFDVFIGENLNIETKLKIKLLTEAASGLLHIHREGLVHCDVAARNILVDDDWAGKICDFGLSRVLKRAVPKADPSLSGPLRWMAPELLLDCSKHSPQSDAWSFGVTIWEIINQQKPYPDLSRIQVKEYVLSGGTLPTNNCAIPLKSIMEDCFKFKAKQRPSMTIIWKRLNEYLHSLL